MVLKRFKIPVFVLFMSFLLPIFCPRLISSQTPEHEKIVLKDPNGNFPQDYIESTRSPTSIRASCHERRISTFLKWINPLSSLSSILAPFIREGDGVNLTGREISITTKKIKNGVTNSQGMIPGSTEITPHSVWGMKNMALP